MFTDARNAAREGCSMHAMLKDIDALPTLRRFGRVARIEGLLVEVTGASGAISRGGKATVSCGNG